MGFNFKSKTVQDNETVVKPNSANITYLTGSKLQELLANKPKPKAQDEKWNVHLSELIEYKLEYGNFATPSKLPSLGST